MTPTLPQLNRWLDAHNMSACISRDSISVTLHVGGDPKPISHHVSWRWADKTISETEGLNQACAIMARDCCLVPPMVALHLNKP